MLDVGKLYPQYNFVQDRRKQSLSVPFERRSGLDRRSGTRIKLDTNLTRDIFDVKSKVQSQVQNNAKKPKVVSFTQNATTVAKKASSGVVHNIANKIVENMQRKNDVAKETANMAVKKEHSSDGMLAGVLATLFVGTIAATFLGTVAGVASVLGLGGLMGGKALQGAVKNHLKK